MPEAAPLTKADADALREIIAKGSHSFYAASRLLPARIREGAFALYAFCRSCDDAIDEGDGGPAALQQLKARLDGVYRGAPRPGVIDRAFARAVDEFQIPRAVPAALIEGMEWDATGRTYETLEDVYAYAARVAGTVGAMMSLVMGVRDESAMARACDLAAAMQLTNIARDVGEDARNGRIYLPRSWLRDGGLDIEAWLAAPTAHLAVRDATQRLLDHADALYARGLSGVAYLPLTCQPAIRAAGLIYGEIGRAVAARGYDSVTSRAVVPGRRKAALVARALAMSLTSTQKSEEAALSENQFLVDAIGAAPPRIAPVDLPDLAPPARMLEVLLRAKHRAHEA